MTAPFVRLTDTVPGTSLAGAYFDIMRSNKPQSQAYRDAKVRLDIVMRKGDAETVAGYFDHVVRQMDDQPLPLHIARRFFAYMRKHPDQLGTAKEALLGKLAQDARRADIKPSSQAYLLSHIKQAQQPEQAHPATKPSIRHEKAAVAARQDDRAQAERAKHIAAMVKVLRGETPAEGPAYTEQLSLQGDMARVTDHVIAGISQLSPADIAARGRDILALCQDVSRVRLAQHTPEQDPFSRQLRQDLKHTRRLDGLLSVHNLLPSPDASVTMHHLLHGIANPKRSAMANQPVDKQISYYESLMNDGHHQAGFVALTALGPHTQEPHHKHSLLHMVTTAAQRDPGYLTRSAPAEAALKDSQQKALADLYNYAPANATSLPVQTIAAITPEARRQRHDAAVRTVAKGTDILAMFGQNGQSIARTVSAALAKPLALFQDAKHTVLTFAGRLGYRTTGPSNPFFTG